MKYRIIKTEFGGHTNFSPQFKSWFGWKTPWDELEGCLSFPTCEEAKEQIDRWNAPHTETVVWSE